MGAGGKIHAAKGSEQAGRESPQKNSGFFAGFLRRSSESVHRLLLYPAKHRNPPSGAVRSLLHHGRESAAGIHGCGRRVYGGCSSHDLLPFCLFGTAVSVPFGIRRAENPHFPVDCDRLRRCPCLQNRKWTPNSGLHHRDSLRLGDSGCQQYGLCHGSGRPGDHKSPLSGYRQNACGL